jgi:predicted SAM-dependent methyltransferase
MKLHLGCGSRYIPGFVHIDAIPFEHIDHVTSVDSLGFLPDGSAEIIYSAHVLEHFTRIRLPSVLKEWNRVLKIGGILRISVPSFEAILRIYEETQDLQNVIGPLFGRQDYLYNFHYNVFDFQSLKQVLMNAGFSRIAEYNWRETEHSGIDDYSQAYFPHMDKNAGIQVSLNVEATKV